MDKKHKPKNIDEYKKWLRDELLITINTKTENHYKSIANKIKSDFIASKSWHDILAQLNEFNNEYLATTGYQLLITDFKPELVTKSYASFLEKTFRKNIIFNRRFPEPPASGWITPDNWIENTNDILRTFFVVKYLDGVEFLMNKLEQSLLGNKLKCDKVFEAREEGYYAAHLYTKCSFEVPKVDWDTENKEISIELQITTQLQEVIGKLTHQFYEDRRVKLNKSDKKWQWDYESEEFTANYLGHLLHYIEGMIMDVRNKQLKKNVL